MAALAAMLAGAAPQPAAALQSDIVAGTFSGLAIGGFDPVAYFGRDAREGRPVYTATWGGVSWQFANEGNMTAFLAAPEIYVPAFGGHCAMAVARGELAEGDPRVFVVHRGRVYLFFAPDDRKEFLADPDRYVRAASRRWKDLAPFAPAELTPDAPTR